LQGSGEKASLMRRRPMVKKRKKKKIHRLKK
jgi:hypothetical protein